MRLLFVGGTRFVGRHMVEAAVARGHAVTVFHRGGPDDVLPEVEHRHGDRNGDLSELSDGDWDATVDASGYVPAQIHGLADALGKRGGRYVFVSSISAYADPPGPGANEDAALIELPAADVVDDPAQVSGENYGGLKVLCERAARERFGDGVLIIRPSYVVGPYDYTGRFTYWVARVADGGEVLVPGPAALPMQVIDARDMGQWTITMVEDGASGALHAASPAPPFSFADLLAEVVSGVAPAGTRLTWVTGEFLAEHGEAESMPLWPGVDDDVWALAVDPSRAMATGLHPRSLAQTARETLAAHRAGTTPVPDGVGISSARQRELLGAWRSATA
jgi:2'-hydroxyisoflavone reductase